MEGSEIALRHAAAVGDTVTLKHILSSSEWVYSAPALGYACRFGGIESVKTLVQNGATFYLNKHDRWVCMNNGECAAVGEYYLMLLDPCSWYRCFEDGWVLDFHKWYKAQRHTKRKILSKEERIQILNFLIENQEKAGFNPGKLLYYAILAEDDKIIAALKSHNITISQDICKSLVVGESDAYWRRIFRIGLNKKMTFEKHLGILEKLYAELGNKQLCCTMTFIQRNDVLFSDVTLMGRLLTCLNHSRLNKLQIMRKCVDRNSVEHLKLFEELGWFNRQQSRDALIDYASEQNNTEMLAWLLDFKNRTADLAAEQARAEKRMVRELNASPNSVYVLSRLWGYKKQEDDTLKIISYKGDGAHIAVPGKIGNRKVTVIDDFAFSPHGVRYRRHKFTSVTLPSGVTSINRGALFDLATLESIKLPDTLVSLGDLCFAKCTSLKEVIIPRGVEVIPILAFEGCSALGRVSLPDGLVALKSKAFVLCDMLKELYIPKSVKHICRDSVDPSTALLIHRDSDVQKLCEQFHMRYTLVD